MDEDNEFVLINEEDCKKAFENGGVDGYIEFLREQKDDWKTIPLHVAVIGNSGVGKSSFINAIRGVTADDDGAASVGEVETTYKIRSYAYPENDLFKLWDLPGVGTDSFPQNKYLEAINVDRYDFFLLLSSNRFTQYDTWLANEIRKRGKQFYFLRTHVSDAVKNHRKAHPKLAHTEDDVLAEIRKKTAENLQAGGNEGTKIFLIDNYKTNKFDFDNLQNSLVDDSPELKRSTLILSMRTFGEKMIKSKAAELRKRIWTTALTSAGVAMIPIPGFSLAFDASVALTSAAYYYHQFGLDDMSLRKQAKLASADFHKLQIIVTTAFDANFFTSQGLTALLQGATGIGVLAANAAEEFFRVIPLFGSVVAAPLSFGSTVVVHRLLITKMESVALKVVKYIAENSVINDDE